MIMGGMSYTRLDNAPVYEFRGRVVNEAGTPVPYASIELKRFSRDGSGRFFGAV